MDDQTTRDLVGCIIAIVSAILGYLHGKKKDQ